MLMREREREIWVKRERDIIGGGATDPRECDEEEKRNWRNKKPNLHSRTPGVGSGSRVR